MKKSSPIFKNFSYFLLAATISFLLTGCGENPPFASSKQITPIAPPLMPSAQNPSQICFSTTFPLEDEENIHTKSEVQAPPHHPAKCKHFVGGYKCIGITNSSTPAPKKKSKR